MCETLGFLDVQGVSKKRVISEMFYPRPEARTRLTETADHSFFLSSYGTNLDLKFEAIFRKSC